MKLGDSVKEIDIVKYSRPFKPPVNCIKCGKELLPLEPDRDVSEAYWMIHSGVVGQLCAPYGSGEDGAIFQVGVCDLCIKELLKEGKLKRVGDYIFPDLDKEAMDS